MSSADYESRVLETLDEKSVSHLEYAPTVLDAESRHVPLHVARIWRKLDLVVLPIISVIYFLFSLVNFGHGCMSLCMSDNILTLSKSRIATASVTLVLRECRRPWELQMTRYILGYVIGVGS